MAKRSRRTRKQAAAKAPQSQTEQGMVAVAEDSERESVSKQPTVSATSGPSFSSKAVDFGTDYYYVYTELRNITVVAVVMFALMIGLGFLI